MMRSGLPPKPTQASNLITRITAQDFVGLDNLVLLLLQGNAIVSVDTAAFQNLGKMYAS